MPRRPAAARARPAIALAALSALVLAPLVTACEDRTRNEAMLFLTRYDALDLDDPIEQRRAAVDALRGLPVSTDAVRSARDACADAYEAEIRAEDRHAEATAELLRVSRGGADVVSTEAAARIEAAIQESQESIERTRALLPRCEREARALRLRFSSPRPSQR